MEIAGTVMAATGEIVSIKTDTAEKYVDAVATLLATGLPLPAPVDEAPALPYRDVLAVGEGAYPGSSVQIVFDDDAVVKLPEGGYSVLLFSDEAAALKAAL